MEQCAQCGQFLSTANIIGALQEIGEDGMYFYCARKVTFCCPGYTDEHGCPGYSTGDTSTAAYWYTT